MFGEMYGIDYLLQCYKLLYILYLLDKCNCVF